MIDIPTKCEMLLTQTVTSKPFSVGGAYRLRTFGPWSGELRLETREDESHRWHPKGAWRHSGERNPLGDHMPHQDVQGAVQRGTHAFFRFVFAHDGKKHESAFMKLIRKCAPATQLPRVVLEADNVVIDP